MTNYFIAALVAATTTAVSLNNVASPNILAQISADKRMYCPCTQDTLCGPDDNCQLESCCQQGPDREPWSLIAPTTDPLVAAHLPNFLGFNELDLDNDSWYCGLELGSGFIDDCVFDEGEVFENPIQIVFDEDDYSTDGPFDPCLCVDPIHCNIVEEGPVYKCGHHCETEGVVIGFCADFLNTKCQESDCDQTNGSAITQPGQSGFDQNKKPGSEKIEESIKPKIPIIIDEKIDPAQAESEARKRQEEAEAARIKREQAEIEAAQRKQKEAEAAQKKQKAAEAARIKQEEAEAQERRKQEQAEIAEQKRKEAEVLTDEEIAELYEAFQIFDANRDGKITLKELSLILLRVNADYTDAQIYSIFQEVDTDENGTIDFVEFPNIFPAMSQPQTEQELMQAFSDYDLDGNGYVSYYELRNVMKTLTDDEVRQMILEADINGDSLINYMEFVRVMTK